MSGVAFSPLTVDEMYALNMPTPEWIIEGLIPRGSVSLMSAREKAGKGLLAIDLLASIASEEPFLDRAVTRGVAMYAAAEESLVLVRERVRSRIGEHSAIPLLVLPLNGLTIQEGVEPDRLRLDDPVGMQKLSNTILEFRVDVLVLDTLRELHDRAENDSDEMGPLLRPLRQLAHQHNIAIIVSHHMNKQNGFRGSTAIRAAFDQELSFVRTDSETSTTPTGTLTVEGRFGSKQVINIALDPTQMRWQPADASPMDSGDTGLRRRILDYLRNAATWTTAKEIADALTMPNYSLKTVQNALAAMSKESPAPFAVDGEGRKNCPRRYHTTFPGLEPVIVIGHTSGNYGGNKGVDIIDSPHPKALRGHDQRNNLVAIGSWEEGSL